MQRATDLENRGWYIAFDLFMMSSILIITVILLRIIHGEFGKEFAYSALVGILGAMLGLVISVVTTPLTDEEHTQWSNLTSAIVGAIAGYGISILDDSITYIFKDANLLQNPILGIRTAIFLSYLAFALLYGFAYRRYYVTIDLIFNRKSRKSNSKEQSNNTPPKQDTTSDNTIT